MPRHLTSTCLALALLGPGLALADDPPKPGDAARRQIEEIKPLPPVAIPDDPPPHEGAMIDLPLVVEPPDILDVEVLEALPGRPITGERLVRPDGTLSLGFYGDVHVRGLTLAQVKRKIILHLRNYLNEDTLGLMEQEAPRGAEMKPLPPPGTILKEPIRGPIMPPPGIEIIIPPGTETEKTQFDLPKKALKAGDDPSARNSSRGRPRAALARRARKARASSLRQDEPKEADQDPKPAAPAEPLVIVEAPDQAIRFVAIRPEDSDRVMVDIVSHNTKVYFVQGDVGVPGRFPFTGKETVLDALNFAGGFLPTAEPLDIHLYRPAQGGKPAKDYKIDHEAILKGVQSANLQIFPNDRLVVGRNPVVKKTVEIDRANALLNSALNTILQYGFTTRTLGSINVPVTGNAQVRVNGQNIPANGADPVPMTPAQRDALLKDWVDFLWAISSKESGALLDPEKFREMMMKKLTPAPEAK